MEISPDTDLNNVTSPGLYFCGAGLTVSNAPPNPMSETAFSLLVERTHATGIKQTLSWYYTGSSYYRTFDGESWHDWMPNATATPPQEYEIPFRDGWESGAYKSTYCKTQDGICLVNCSVYGTGVASENFIATLPTGFRPSATVCCAAHSYKNGIRGISETEILANGDIVVFSPIEFDYVSFSFVFVAEN